MTTSRSNSIGKDEIEEKSSYSPREEFSGSPDNAKSLSYSGSPKPGRLPIAWQLVMIVLTCLCTCE